MVGLFHVHSPPSIEALKHRCLLKGRARLALEAEIEEAPDHATDLLRVDALGTSGVELQDRLDRNLEVLEALGPVQEIREDGALGAHVASELHAPCIARGAPVEGVLGGEGHFVVQDLGVIAIRLDVAQAVLIRPGHEGWRNAETLITSNSPLAWTYGMIRMMPSS